MSCSFSRECVAKPPVAPNSIMGQSKRQISPSPHASLQNLGLSGIYSVWPRMDLKSKCFRTSAKGGPSWKDVEARVTLDALYGGQVDEQLEFCASTGTARLCHDESRANEAPALPASGGILARGSTWTPTRLAAQLSCSADF